MEYALLHLDYTDTEVIVISHNGELMEIGLSGTDQPQVGDFVSLNVSGREFEARVLRVDEDRVFLFVPSAGVPLGDDRRNEPRLEVELPALLIGNRQMLSVKIADVHPHGVGFLCGDSEIANEADYHLVINGSNMKVIAEIRISNSMQTADGYRYGAQIRFMKKEDLRQLQLFLMYLRMARSLA